MTRLPIDHDDPGDADQYPQRSAFQSFCSHCRAVFTSDVDFQDAVSQMLDHQRADHQRAGHGGAR